jgi:hypothetical protein
VCQQVPDEAGVHDVIQQLCQQGQVLLRAQQAGVVLVEKLGSSKGCKPPSNTPASSVM